AVSADPLSVEVDPGRRARPAVFPRRDEAAGAVGDDRRLELGAGHRADRDAARGPLRDACGVDLLSEEVTLRVGALVDPDHAGAPRPVADRGGGHGGGPALISGRGADRHAARAPEQRAAAPNPLAEEIEIARRARRAPENDHASGAIRDEGWDRRGREVQ